MNLSETTMDIEVALSIKQRGDIGALAKMMPESLYDWEKSDVQFLTEMLRNFREVKRQAKKSQFRVGDRVTFEITRQKYGGTVNAIGTITKINPKTIRVQTDEHGGWRITADYLFPYFPPVMENVIGADSDSASEDHVFESQA